MRIPDIIIQLREEEKLGFLSCKGVQELNSLDDNKSNEHSQTDSVLYSKDEDFYKDNPDKIFFEEEFKSKESFLDDVFNSISDGLSVLDKNLNIIKTNRFMEEMYSKKMPLVGKKCYEVYQDRDSICPWCPSLKAMETRKTQFNIVPYPDKNNPQGWLNLSAYPLIDKDGDIFGVIEYVKNISDQMKAQKELEDLSQKLKNIFNSSSSAIITTDDKGIVTSWNPASVEIFGWKTEEVIGKFNPTVTKDMKDIILKTIRKKVTNLEIKALTKNKDLIDINLSTAPIFEGDRFVGNIGIMTDITEIKKTEEKYKLLFNSINIGIFTLDLKGKILEINPSIEKIFGYNKDELIGIGITKLTSMLKVNKIKVISMFKDFLLGKIDKTEWDIITKDGDPKYISVFPSVIKENGVKKCVLALITDITNQKKAHLDLKEKYNELEKFHNFSVDREIKMIELKKEINSLLERLDENPKYEIID